MESSTILANVRKKYAACTFYKDVGQIFRQKDDQSGEVTRFRTNFERSKMFRFEWKDLEKGEFEIWSEGEQINIRTPRSKARQTYNLRDAIGETAGISQGATSLVPNLLIGDTTILSNPDLTLNSIALEPLYWLECHHIVGSLPGQYDIQFWIDEQFRLRKIRTVVNISLEAQRQLLVQAAEVASMQCIAFPDTLSVLKPYTLIKEFSFEDVQIS